MKPINKEPARIDFNDGDRNNSTWLSLPLRSAVTGKELGIKPEENQILWVTDGELEGVGRVTYLDDRWVFIPVDELKEVSKDSPHHIDNQK